MTETFYKREITHCNLSKKISFSRGLEGGYVWVGGKKSGGGQPWKYHETEITYSNWNGGGYDVSIYKRDNSGNPFHGSF